MSRKKIYVVVHGRQPGIYQQWFGEEGAYEQVLAATLFDHRLAG